MRLLVALCLSMPGVAFAQAATDVLWYHGNGGAELGSAGFSDAVSGFGGDLVIEDQWANIGNLSDYRFVVVARPSIFFDSSQKAQLQAFVDSFGVLILLGDSTLGATLDGILAINDLTTTLGLDIELVDSSFSTPGGTCELGTIVNSNPFIDVGTPLSLDSIGDIAVGANGTVVETFSFFVSQTGETLTFTMLAHQGLVLLASDYQAFTNDTCSLASKEALWLKTWNLYCDRDQDGDQIVECGGFDCDDTDPTIGAAAGWLDLDGDGFGDPNAAAPCLPNAVANSEDCDDTNADVNPTATEVCDGVDNNCDLLIDNDAEAAVEWFVDFDGDGFGRSGDAEIACDQPDGKVDNQDDCNDGLADVYPGAPEVCANAADDDCDGDIDEGCPTTPGTTTPPPSKPCAVGGSHLLGVSWLIAAVGLIRRRERR